MKKNKQLNFVDKYKTEAPTKNELSKQAAEARREAVKLMLKCLLQND